MDTQVRRKNIEMSDTSRLLDDLGTAPMAQMVPELAREIERAMTEAGLTVEELLVGLREQRASYYEEHYADDAEQA